MGLGGFEIATANGGKAELPTPGGASREVTLDNRLEFVELAEAFKMREYRVPVRREERTKKARGFVVLFFILCFLVLCRKVDRSAPRKSWSSYRSCFFFAPHVEASVESKGPGGHFACLSVPPACLSRALLLPPPGPTVHLRGCRILGPYLNQSLSLYIYI